MWLGTSSLGLELIESVDTFPGELNIFASKMPIDCTLPIDRPLQIKMINHPARRQGENPSY